MSWPEAPEDREVRAQLRGLRVEPGAADFEAALHRKLVAAGPPEGPGGWLRLTSFFVRHAKVAWPAVGLATGIAAFVALSVLRAGPMPTPMPGPAPIAEAFTAEVPSTKVAVIRLNFSADVAVESAEFRVSLPEGLAFWSDGEALAERSFEWTQPLRAGDNVIPVAVRGQRPGHYRVTAIARIGDELVEHEVLLEVTDG